jgi:serine/threonine protein kinase/Flp pilus assembly protein TadD
MSIKTSTTSAHVPGQNSGLDQPALAENHDQILADLVEDLTAQMHANGFVDWQTCARQYPQYVDELRELLPALEALAGSWKDQEAARQGDREKKGLLSSPDLTVSLSSAPSDSQFATRHSPLILGDFRLIREIGRGGMGVVYEAEQTSLNRRVALKVLPFAAALDSRHLQRFKTEAQAAAQLHHTNIVPVHAVGCEQGTHYYAMQFIEGQTLATVIQSKIDNRKSRMDGSKPATEPTSGTVENGGNPTRSSSPQAQSSILDPRSSTFRDIAKLGIQAAEALEYAHQMGVVHRDIKPANLLIDVRGNLWITDFGLARLARGIGSESASPMTGTGDLLGTIRYMSPEQAAGKRGTVDHRSDIYSLGVTLYEWLTLRPAISGRSREEVLAQVALEDPPLPRRIDKTIPVELETIILKAIAKRWEDRYGSAQELGDDLRCFLEDKPIRARRPSLADKVRKWARRHQSLVRMAGVFALLAVAGLVVSTVLIVHQRNVAEARRRQARRAADEMYALFAESWLSRQPGMEALEKEFLLKALSFYEEFAQDNGNRAEDRFETAKAFRRIGDINYKLGQFDQAKYALAQATDRLQLLSSENRENTEYPHELAIAINSQANIERDEDQAAQAEQSYRRAQGLFEDLIQTANRVPQYRDGLAGVESNRGIVLTALGRMKEAEQAYLRSLALLEELTADYPDLPTYRHDLGGCLNNLGNLLASIFRFRDAEILLRRALPIREKLADEYPTFPAYRQALAQSHTSWGALLAATHRYREAEDEYRQSQYSLEKLSSEFPLTPDYRQQQAANAAGLACLLTAAGRVTEARDAHRRALALRTKEKPESSNAQDVAASHYYLGQLAVAMGQYQDAEHSLRQALALRQENVAKLKLPGAQLDLAVSYHQLANLLATVGRLSESESNYRLALEIYSTLAPSIAEIPAARLEAASGHCDLGALCIEKGRLREAENELRQSLKLLQDLEKDCPECTLACMELVKALDRLSWIYEASDRPAEAERTFDIALALAEKLATENSANPDGRQLAAQLLFRRAEKLSAGQTPKAINSISKALTLQAKLADAFPAIPEIRSELARSLNLLGCLLTREGKRIESANTFAQVRQLYENLIEDVSGAPSYFQEYSWFLATCPEESFRNPTLALSLAERATTLGPEQSESWSALGLAHFRTRNWQKAETAFQKAIQLKKGGTCVDWLFLAMSCHHLGNHAQARNWMNQALAWKDRQRPLTDEMGRFFAEVETHLPENDREAKAGGGQR